MLGRLSIFAALVTLVFALLPNDAEAARGKNKSGVNTEAQVGKLKRRAERSAERALKKTTKKLDGMQAVIDDFKNRGVTDLRADVPNLNARMHKLSKKQDRQRKRLNALRQKNLAEFARSRRIEYIPAPPSSAPPPLPDGPAPGQLTVVQPTPKNPKAVRPPGGASARTFIDPQI